MVINALNLILDWNSCEIHNRAMPDTDALPKPNTDIGDIIAIGDAAYSITPTIRMGPALLLKMLNNSPTA